MTGIITRRTFVAGSAAGALALPRLAFAQQPYPAGQPVKFIVPFAAGGATDVVGRIAAERLGLIWKSPTIVENVAGAGSNLGAERVAKGPQDGSQILVMGPPTVNNQFLFSKLSYDPVKDLTPISQVALVPNLLCVKKDFPVSTVPELIAYAKANPGKINCATAGIGSSGYLSAELFKIMAGVEMALVHYRGSAPSITDLVAGNVDMVFDNIGAIINQARGGQVKAIAITKLERSPLAPEYPTVHETLPGFETSSFVGLGVRWGTPKEICDIIERDALTLGKETAVRDKLATIGVELTATSTADFTAWMMKERAKWGKLITDLKIKIE